ncbi:MAG: YncE family protein [Gammaproteobacteria bacterium]|nr:YncE family protein [Gammaproteobacteria bacterium]
MNRHSLLPNFALLTLIGLSSPSHAEMEKTAHYLFPNDVFISMKTDASVQHFPAQTLWQGGANMLYTAISPDGKTVLATSPSSQSLYVFDAKSGQQRAVITVGKAPKGVKISPDGQWAYVSNQGSANISVIELNTLQVVDTIKVGKEPHNARFSHNGKWAYVTLQGGAGLGLIDTQKRKMIKVIPLPGLTGPHNLDLSKDGKIAFVRDFVHHVAVLDLTTNKVKKIITVGNGHGGIDVSPDGRYAITTAIGDTVLSVIDTQTLEVTSIELGNGSHGVRSSADNRWIYVTLPQANEIAVINSRTLKIERRIKSGKFPFWIALQDNP